MLTVKVTPGFRVVIPRQVREGLNSHPGQVLQVVQFADRFELVPLQDVKSMRGFLKGISADVRKGKDHRGE